MDQEELVGRIEDVLQCELRLFREMEHCSRQQLAALSQEEPDAEKAAQLMTNKEAIVSQLDDLDATAAQTKADWRRMAQHVPKEAREHIRTLMAEVASLLKTLIVLEEENEAKLRSCSSAVNRQLALVRQARLASRAYTNQLGPEDARFVDRKE